VVISEQGAGSGKEGAGSGDPNGLESDCFENGYL
jgi:hypothetical protein